MIKNLLYLSILTVFAVLSWIGFNIYHNFSTSTVPAVTSIKVVPITPVFDTASLQSLKERKRLEVDLSQKISPVPEISGAPVATPIPSRAPIGTGSAFLEVSSPSSQITSQL